MAASGWMPLSWLLLTLSLCKTPLGETGCLDNPYFLFTGCLSIRFFDSTQHSQLDHLWLTVLHCAALVGLSGRHASHWSPVLPTQPLPREAEDFPRGKRHLCTKDLLEARVSQPWNLVLTGFEPAFLKVSCVHSCLSW